MPRALAIFLAFAIGWIVYMIAMVMTVYDGVMSMIFQPFIAMFGSALVVGVSLLVGSLFRIPVLERFWSATPIPALALVACSLAILCFGSQFGLRQTFTDPETKQQVVGLRSEAALGGYFVLVFAIANWPAGKRHIAESDTAPSGGPATSRAKPRITDGPPSES